MIEFRLDANSAQKWIRQIADKTENIIIGDHALERMEERDIFDVDVYRVLRGGFVTGIPEGGNNEGEWKCKIVMKLRGHREAGVVTIILRSRKLFVKTVEWEDIK